MIKFILALESRYPYLFRIKNFTLITSTNPVILNKNLKTRPSRSRKIIIQSIYIRDSQRLMIFHLLNPSLLTNENLFKKIFNTLKKEKSFLDFGKNKIIIIQVIINDRTYSLTHNIKINNKMRFNEYWDLIKNNIINNYDKDYLIDAYKYFKVLIWNMDNVKNKTITYSNSIKVGSVQERFRIIKDKFLKGGKRQFSTNNKFITPLKESRMVNPFITYNRELLNDLNNIKIKIVFVHDQNNKLFQEIYNDLLTKFDPSLINLLKDKNNQYIYIKIFNIKFLNSYKIFPVQESEFNQLFKSKSLQESLVKAQNLYFKDYGVDITTIVSIGSLSFKIFRINYLNVNIPIPSKNEAFFIRNSYFGGAVHLFKQYTKRVYHYDINSLYPFAMLKPMPYKLIKIITDFRLFNLDNFFGFLKVEVTINKSVKRILLPRKLDDKTIYEPGIFVGTYFSEEIKYLSKLNGYNFRFIEAYSYSKFYPFKSFVNNFYLIKQNNVGIKRFIAKSLLNNLYGFFGRTYELISTLYVKKINFTDLLVSNLNITNIDEFNDYFLINYINNNDEYLIKSNVAIASAITSWARIIMFPYLLLPFVLYSDTDSIFTSSPIDPILIGKEIGKFKDEMNGLIIQEAIFLGPKRYGYWFFDKNNKRIERSVYAGLERNSIT